MPPKTMTTQNVFTKSVKDRDFLAALRAALAKKKVSKTYFSNAKRFLEVMVVDSIKGATTLKPEEVDAVLGQYNKHTASAWINGFLQVVDRLELSDKFRHFAGLQDISNRRGNEKMDRMKDNEYKDLPNVKTFYDKVDEYLQQHPGTETALTIALFAGMPPLRSHSYEGLRLVQTTEEFDKLKKAGKPAICTTNGRMFVPEDRLKVKGKALDTTIVEASVLNVLDLISLDRRYVFEKTGHQPLKTQQVNARIIPEAFEKIGYKIGVQKLRRLYASKISNNPILSVREREELGERMNHNMKMQLNYAVKASSPRTPEVEALLKNIGAHISDLVSAVRDTTDKATLQAVADGLQGLTRQVMELPIAARTRGGRRKK